MIKAVVFDLDDTLYDAKGCYDKGQEKLVQFALDQYGEERDFFLSGFWQARLKVKDRLGEVASCHNRLLYIQAYQELRGRKSLQDVITMYDLYWETALLHMTVFPYVYPLLEELKKRNVKIGILTDLTSHIQHRKITALGLETFVDALVTSEEAGCEKPSPEIFKLMLGKLSVRAEETLMIGDSEAKDIQGAENVGMQSILYTEKTDVMLEVRKRL